MRGICYSIENPATMDCGAGRIRSTRNLEILYNGMDPEACRAYRGITAWRVVPVLEGGNLWNGVHISQASQLSDGYPLPISSETKFPHLCAPSAYIWVERINLILPIGWFSGLDVGVLRGFS